MSRIVIPHYVVVRDTREKEEYGWNFHPTPNKSRPPKCLGMVTQKLDTGDYSAVGYEDILAIERKWDLSELWINYGDRKRFEEEMERISCFRYAYMLIETHLTKEAMNLSPPQFKTKAPGKALISWLIELTIKYGVHIWLTGDQGRRVASRIIENIVHLERDRWIEIGERNEQEKQFIEN